MPFCPNCRTEYRDGVTACADCDVSLADSLPVSEEDVFESVDPVLLHFFEDGISAEIVKNALEENGIPRDK